MNKIIHVAVAVIRNSSDKILLSKRPDHVHQGGLWEFPGGKVEANESVEQALVRELQEELDIVATTFRPLISIPHQYPDKTVLLDVWEVTEFLGSPKSNEDQPLCWVDRDQLAAHRAIPTKYPLPEANYGIVKAIQLPKMMAITGDFEDDVDYKCRLERAINRGAKIVQCRLPAMAIEEAAKLLKLTQETCLQKRVQFCINNHFNSQLRSTADGQHLTSDQLMSLKSREGNFDSLLGASCHNDEQLRHAEQLDLDYVVLSPVQITQSHPDNSPLGWSTFQQKTQAIKIPVYALGGMNSADVDLAVTNGGQGIAAISAFWGDEDD